MMSSQPRNAFVVMLLLFIGLTTTVKAQSNTVRQLITQSRNCLQIAPDTTTVSHPKQSKTKMDFFPVPIIESRPDEGQSYGLLPVVLFSNRDTGTISTILGAVGQYNSITRMSGGGLAYYYPGPTKNPDEVFEFYFELAQRHYRETSLRYFNPHFKDRYFVEGKFVWLKTPFQRFFGYGAATTEANESNYVGENFLGGGTFGFYFLPMLRANISETITATSLYSRAFTNVADTLTTYGALSGMNNTTNLLHTISITYDTRPTGMASLKGTFLQGSYFFSHQQLGSDTTFNGFNMEAIRLFSWFNERTTTALRFFLQDMYGANIPFYLQSQLGGDKELRAFIPDRFTDTGKVILSFEQRIKVLSLALFGKNVNLYADPFFELGRVFHHINNLSFDNLQPVGGLGLRMQVPPNVLARADLGVGREGYGVYTMLGYAF